MVRFQKHLMALCLVGAFVVLGSASSAVAARGIMTSRQSFDASLAKVQSAAAVGSAPSHHLRSKGNQRHPS
jgi:hypothetical protein